MIANFINYGTEQIHPWGWRLSLGLSTVPAIIMFLGSLFLPETPNSLVEQGKLDEARSVLEKVLRGKAGNEAEAVKNPFGNLMGNFLAL